MSAPVALRFSVLGVQVEVRCDDSRVLDRLGLCYESSAYGGNGAAVSLDVEPGESVAATVRSTHHELLQAVMRAQPAYFYVHAGVVAVDDRAVILPGLSQAGKSTLVLALVEAGARYLSDEALVWDPRTRRALAFPRAIKIRDECVDYFNGRAGDFVGDGEARFLPLAALGPDRVAACASPRLVVAPLWGDHTSLDPISRGSGLLELTKSALNFGTHRATSIEHLADVVEPSDCYRLQWREPHGAAALVLDASGAAE